MAPAILTADYVRQIFNYDTDSGLLTWRIRTSNRIQLGAQAGNRDHYGYLKVCVSYRYYKVHRLIWLHVHGVWPTKQIDHIDRDKLNNRIANLRDVSQSVNQQNRFRARTDNASGFLGVTRHSASKRWQTQIDVNGRRHYLGLFDTPEAAHAVYLDAKRLLHSSCTI